MAPGLLNGGPIMARIDEYLHLMVQRKASDLHLSSCAPPMFRVGGDMTPIADEPLSADTVMSVVEEIMPDRNKQEWNDTNDTDFAYELDETMRFRVNVFTDRNGIGAVLRGIPTKILGFKDLGLPDCIKKLCFLNKGLVLVTGPTGSGKSTTLAAMIDFINDNRHDHIITIEDPVEFVHRNKKCIINQREVHTHTDSFKKALRAALREDPDIVLVGEMRDLETVMIALETAETGHLVFGTLHTSTSHGTIERLINQFPADEQAQVRIGLAESLKGVVAQTLCKKKGGGRVAALEILMGSHALGANIREGKIHQIPMLIQTGMKQGMRSLNDSLLDLISRNVVDPVEAYQKAIVKDELIKRMAALPNCRSPRGTPWTEDDLIKAAEEANGESAAAASAAGNGNGNGNGNGHGPGGFGNGNGNAIGGRMAPGGITPASPIVVR
jgi:twitching motility protein PilT